MMPRSRRGRSAPRRVLMAAGGVTLRGSMIVLRCQRHRLAAARSDGCQRAVSGTDRTHR